MKLLLFLALFFISFYNARFFAFQNIDSTWVKKQEDKIAAFINCGYYNNALINCDALLKLKVSKDQRYRLITTKSKIYFWMENMYQFKKAAEDAFVIRKDDSPIYEAYYHAQIGFYFHYFIIGDSAQIHAEKALNLLHKNFDERAKISAHFIYQIYGTCGLYRKPYNMNYGNEILSKKKRVEPILSYLDSALIQFNENPRFPQEKAIIYRSKGSRMFDLVGYAIRTKKSDFQYPTFEKEVLTKVIDYYSKAVACLPQKEKRLRTNMDGALSMAYYCNNEPEKGDAISLPYIDRYLKNPIGEILPSIMNSMSVTDYFIKNAILRKTNQTELKKLLQVNYQILPYWNLFVQHENLDFYDAYSSSPAKKIILLEEYFKSDNPKYNRVIATYAFEQFYYYSKKANAFSKKIHYNQNQYRHLLAKIESQPSDKKTINALLNFSNRNKNVVDIGKIQEKLKQGEAIWIFNIVSGLKNLDVCILKNKIKIFQDKFLSQSIDEERLMDIDYIKKQSEKIRRDSPPFTYLLNQKVKKIYVTPNIIFPFDWIVLNSKGATISELSFLKKSVNIVKMYNPVDFFTSEEKEQTIQNHISAFWLNKASVGKLPFTSRLIEQNKNNNNNKLFGLKDLKSKGVLQLVGHGQIFNESSFRSSALESKEFNSVRMRQFKVEKELVILNVCYAGMTRWLNIFDLNVNNLLLSRGAKAVISSPYETVDQSSAYIFEKFYAYLAKGETVEDALHLAKLDYLKTHKGSLAHPMYWSTYELTSNVKDLRLATEPVTDKSWQVYLLFFVLLAVVFRFYLYSNS
ncbi:MAG: CHAT domain-containing protein [Flavobacteriales bacterium]|nr:CHAT domain-containing protein [Flavobacteriales bacterium]